MAKQTKFGKAFEYSLAVTLYNKINNGQKVQIKQDAQFDTAKKAFGSFGQKAQEKYDKAANAAVEYIVKLEPRLEHPISDDEITIVIQSDQKGATGDIRDVVTLRSKHNWQIGFSAKNNNMAVKHSRLSDLINFGKEWVDIPCSQQYMDNVGKIFGELRWMMEDSKKKGHVLLWKEMLNKKHEIYTKVLDAFQTEMIRLVNSNVNVPDLLLKYLIGRNDFYKIMKFKNQTTIQSFNMYGTLNQPSNTIHALKKIQKLKPPAKIDEYERKKIHTLLIRFDEGWQLSFRIHNASSRVEPSLKFDIKLTGVPSGLSGHDEF